MAARTIPTVRKAFALLVGALVALCALPIVDAQAADPSVSLQLAQPRVALDAANTTTLTATVTNDNAQLAGSVRMDAIAPDGWAVVADPLQFPLAAGASQVVTLTLTAPEPGIGAATGDVRLTATITENAATARTDAATASVAVERVDPLPPPPPPPAWYETTLGMAAIAAGVLATLGAIAGGFVWRRRTQRLAAEAAAAAQAAFLDRETGITIARLDEPRAFGPKREVIFRVQLENVSARPRVAVVRVETPDGWNGAPSMPRIPLSPGERSVLTVCVRPHEATGETAEVQVVVKPEEATERDERVRVQVSAPAARSLTPEEGPRVAPPTFRTTANQRAPTPPTTLKP